MQWRPCEVAEYENEIKLLQRELNSFKRGNFDVGDRDNSKGRIRKMNNTICRRLQFDVGAIRHSFKCKFSKRNVNFETIVAL